MGKRGWAAAVVTALVLGATGAATATADTSADAAARIDRAAVQRALDAMTRTGAAGVQVRITEGNRQFAARSGVAEWGRERPVPLDGRFRIGSVTKTFVSTVVLQLVGEGRVELDAPVGRYLPGLLPDGDRITVRMLLQHTSGLHDYTGSLPSDPVEQLKIRYKHWEPAELVALSTAKPLNFPPGTRFDYSNTNFAVAGMLIKEVTGRPYDVEVERRVLRPLGLRATFLPGDRPGIPGPHAHSYVRLDGRVEDITRFNPSVAGAAGSMISTTADLDRFADALLGGELLKPAQLAEMMESLPFSEGYGLGFAAYPMSCGTTAWGHDGVIFGYSTAVLSTADTGTRLVVSFSSGPDEGEVEGLRELLDEVFC
ncbi:serine hydrolase domain-containing protein [Saccharothrix coeruleofusca]|uniref:Serine hydrolase n=1 Tax=Saccharothrix coeruleofusca TaxID=33919 RepID=A0A918EGQ5_9PSEU|nr:serine hydrolase domain-containing protein [Saccharothrix coeruleofusca]GGP83253.1 serine hydrolase [Saccharothrix coeruleofusca]